MQLPLSPFSLSLFYTLSPCLLSIKDTLDISYFPYVRLPLAVLLSPSIFFLPADPASPSVGPQTHYHVTFLDTRSQPVTRAWVSPAHVKKFEPDDQPASRGKVSA